MSPAELRGLRVASMIAEPAAMIAVALRVHATSAAASTVVVALIVVAHEAAALVTLRAAAAISTATTAIIVVAHEPAAFVAFIATAISAPAAAIVLFVTVTAILIFPAFACRFGMALGITKPPAALRRAAASA
jgi:hypothetical protein